MNREDIRSLTTDKIEGIRERFQGESAVSSIGVSFHSLVDAITQVIADGKLNKDDADAISEVAQELFDTFVVPFDIPYVPAIIEVPAEQALRAAIPTIVNLLLPA